MSSITGTINNESIQSSLEQQTQGNILRLPSDILKKIFTYLTSSVVFKFAATSKEVRAVHLDILSEQKALLSQLIDKASKKTSIDHFSYDQDSLCKVSTFAQLNDWIRERESFFRQLIAKIEHPKNFHLSTIEVLHMYLPAPSIILNLPRKLLYQLPTPIIERLADLEFSSTTPLLTIRLHPLCSYSPKTILDLLKKRSLRNVDLFTKVSDKLKNDKNFILSAVSIDGLLLQSIPEDLQKDFEVVKAAITQNGSAFQYASKDLQKNSDLVLLAVSKDPEVLITQAEESWLENKQIVLCAVSQNGLLLDYASDSLKEDPCVVNAAVKQDGLALKFASESLKKNRDTVLAAVQQTGDALQYAAQELKNDLEIVKAAVSQNSSALEFAAENLQKNFEVAIAAVKQKGEVLRFLSEQLRSDFRIVKAAVEQNSRSLRWASQELKKNPELLAIKNKERGS